MNIFAKLFLLVCFIASTLSAQEVKRKSIQIGDGRIEVPLKLNTNFNSPFFFGVDFRENPSTPLPNEIGKVGEVKTGKARGNLLVSAVRSDESDILKGGYFVKVDENGNGSLEDEKAFYIKPDSSKHFWVERTLSDGRKVKLPYKLWFAREIENEKIKFESLRLWTDYCADGELTINKKKYKIRIKDTNADGLFNEADVLKGSTISIDLNNDGKFSGADEIFAGKEVISINGTNLLYANIKEDGSLITFAKTTIPKLKVGDKLPELRLKTTSGELLNTTKLIGKPLLLDFWGTWCYWCVAAFDSLPSFSKKYNLEIISICTDEPNYIDRAKKVLSEKKLPWKQVLLDHGMEDVNWKILGSVGNSRMMVPLYILIDDKGKIAYADYGGEPFLQGLKKNIELLVGNKKSGSL